tara:strand:+ start:7422 stop:7940 length:519 start_codon:yes stop_codon:yes gene_type:complete
MSRDGVSRSSKRIIRVTPTLDTSAYAAGDVAFIATEIPRAVLEKGGCSKLVNAYIMDQDRDTYDLDLIFTEKNTAIGTLNATANIGDASMEAIGLCGFCRFKSDVAFMGGIDQVSLIRWSETVADSERTSAGPIFLQADSDSTSVYVSGIISSGTPTFAAADDIDIVLHIED